MCRSKHGSAHRINGLAASLASTIRHGIRIGMYNVYRVSRHAQTLGGNQRERRIGTSEINGTNDDGKGTIRFQATSSGSWLSATGPASSRHAYPNLPTFQFAGYVILLQSFCPKRVFLRFLPPLEKANACPRPMIHSRLTLFQSIFHPH